VIDVSAGPTTVRLKTGDEVTPSAVALMLALPMATPAAKPCLLTALLTVATAMFEEAQTTALVKS
jgi:hypothetical protein